MHENTGKDIRMSAPPMAAVVVQPLAKLRIELAARQVAAMAGAPGAIVTNAPIVATLAPRREALIRCLPGRTIGREDKRPPSLRNATMDPVNVTPPAHTSAHTSG